jgi:6-phosphogluconate dehydrogenase
MKIGFIGLGRMGSAMVERLVKSGHEVLVYNRTAAKTKEAEKKGAQGTYSLDELLKGLSPPRIIWVMVPAGRATLDTVEKLTPGLSSGDILIDGGNSYYKDSLRLGKRLDETGVRFLDCGTSGGVWGLENGYCLMVGGEKEVFDRCRPLFEALAPPEGCLHVGPHGAGHFVKMIHNGIEYGMLQAYGEGFEILNASDYSLDLKRIAHLWNRGSVVRSWLLELAESAFAKDAGLSKLKGYVEDSGEGRWSVQEAVEKNVSAPVITLALLERLRSRTKESFSAKVIAALRNEFGGHKTKESK